MERLEIEESSEGLLTKHNKFLSKKVHQASVFSCICFILIIVALIILLVFTIRILIVLYQQKGNNNCPNVNNTVTPQNNAVLNDLSNYILSNMDTTVDPCEDFYQYSCGSWLRNTKLPSDKSSWALSFSVLHDKNLKILRSILEEDWPMIGVLYNNCMNLTTIDNQGTTPLNPFWTSINSIVTISDFFKVLGQLHRSGIGSMFQFWVDVDAKNPTVYLPTLWQGGLGLPNKDYYFNHNSSMDQTFAALRSQYLQYLGNLYSLMGANSNISSTVFASHVLSIETSLASVSLSPEALRDPNIIYNKIDFTQLQTLTPNIPWTSYFLGLSSNSITIPQLNVVTSQFFSGLDQLIISTPISQLKHYLQGHLLTSSANLLSNAFQQEAFKWRQALYGINQLPPRWETCVGVVDNSLGELLGRYFVTKQFSGNSKSYADQLVNELKIAFLQDLNEITWMDANTKHDAQLKLQQFITKIGYPDKWTNYNSLFLEPGNYFGNIINLAVFETNKALAKIGSPVDKSEWFMTPSQVNAYYNPTGNEIVFPAGILQPPFFNASYPSFANFGGIGAVIGHEITHGFDDKGRYYDGIGKLANWWTNESSINFESRAQCVIDQYSHYEVLPGQFINGKLTAGESLADLGGLRIAYIAYQNWLQKNGEGHSIQDIQTFFPGFTTLQLFFISYAQLWCSLETDAYISWLTQNNPHPLDKFRAIGATSNFNAFWESFNCPVGSKMHPANSCRVW